MRNALSTVLALAVLPALASCGDDPTGPAYPNLRGTYAATWSYMFDAGEFGSFAVSCTGSLNITQQSAGEFSGSYITNASSEECESSSGSISGEIRTDGGLNFVLDTPGADDEFSAVTGCTVVSADNQLNGTFRNNTIAADANAVIDCPTEEGVLRAIVDLEILAVKS